MIKKIRQGRTYVRTRGRTDTTQSMHGGEFSNTCHRCSQLDMKSHMHKKKTDSTNASKENPVLFGISFSSLLPAESLIVLIL